VHDLTTLLSCIFPNQLFVGTGLEKVSAFTVACPRETSIGRANLIAVFIQQLTWYITAALWNVINRAALILVLVNFGGWIPHTLRLYLTDLILYTGRHIVALAARQHQTSEKKAVD
jgi:hypothetical protein